MTLRGKSIDAAAPPRLDRRHHVEWGAGARSALWLSLLLGGLACGGKAPSESTDLDLRAQKHEVDRRHAGQPCQAGAPCPAGHDEAGEMANMPPSLAKFHDTLAPRWHAPHGPQRMADTCGAIAQFHADAQAIATSTPPDGSDAAAWAAGKQQLTEAVAALDATCKASDAAAFEPAFERVHVAFHHLMEAAAGEHGEAKHEH